MSEEVLQLSERKEEGIYPVLPLRDIVTFPHMIVPLFVGREKSICALEASMCAGKQVLLVTQRNPGDDNPSASDLFDVGSLANVLQLLKLPDGTVKVLIEGVARARIVEYTGKESYIEAYVDILEEDATDIVNIEALGRSLINAFKTYTKLNKKIHQEIVLSIDQIEGYSRLSDVISSHSSMKIYEKQAILEITSLSERLKRLLEFVENEVSVLQAEKRIRTRVKLQMEKTQREYYLNEKMKAIQKELGDSHGTRDEFSELEEKIEKTKFPKEVREKVVGELRKLRQMSPMSAEAAVVRNFLDWMLSIPWRKQKKLSTNLESAKDILDTAHYALTDVKERIIEYLAVQARTKKLKGPILCLLGPPGVGKTSLGKSIAKATGREFMRISLGGVRDEAEIRGHRRTYIGAMPGKIIQSMRKSKTINPLILLDEVDKMGSDFRGDPSSVLLEVLDPEQNDAFSDHYLEVGYDLSRVMFIATANTLDIQPPLLDRMEIIRIAGYTESEKYEIARSHLIPKAFRDHGLREGELSISDGALTSLIRCYTREAGVRGLERQIAKIARKVVRKLSSREEKSISVDDAALPELLGAPKYRFGQVELENRVGVVIGLAWTAVGGDLLTIEAVIMPGTGSVTVTGSLRDVMKESITASGAYVRSRSLSFGVQSPFFKEHDIHVHVPEAATPKDGPSAGVAMVTAIVSVITGIPVHRDVAMTGEITLRGRVLPVGGIKEKLLAALRGGIQTVLIPEDNIKDLDEVPEEVRADLRIVPVSKMEEVLKRALVSQVQPVECEEKSVTTSETIEGGSVHDEFHPLTAH